MADNPDNELDIKQVVEALLNICGQAAEMQIDEESRNAIYDMCDALAHHHDIPRFDAEMVDNGDGTHTVSYYGNGIAEGAADTKFKPELKLVVDNPDDDDDTTIH